MFIKIKTIMYVDRDLGWQPVSEVFINTDKIVEIVPLDAGPYVIDLGGADYRYTITAAEWQRIAPLLMPASAEPIAAHDGTVLLRLLDTWQDAKSRTWNGATIDYAREKKRELLDYIQTQYGLPAALVSAYREYQRMLSLTGISQHRIDMQRAILIDVLGANMPLEETDHD